MVLGYLFAVALLGLLSLWPKLAPRPHLVQVETWVEVSFQPPAPEPVSLNQASLEELMELPGVSPVLAQRIVEGRPYTRVEDLVTTPRSKEQGFSGTSLNLPPKAPSRP